MLILFLDFALQEMLIYTFFYIYKEYLCKELEAEKGSKNKEFLRN